MTDSLFALKAAMVDTGFGHCDPVPELFVRKGVRYWRYADGTILPMIAGGAQAPPKPEVVLKDAIPETSEELAELLADEKRREQVMADPETAADFLQKYVRSVNKARPDIQRMIDDGIEKGMTNFMIQNGVKRPDVTVNVKELPQKGAAYSKHAIGTPLDKEFEDTADFLMSIYHNNQAGTDRWRKIRMDYSSIEPSAGGFLIPEVLRSELLRVALETAIVRPRARVIPMDSARVPFPTVDTTSHASSVFGGVIGYWTEEGASLTETEAKFGRVILDAKKLATYCEVPNELLQDSIISFAAFIDDILPKAIAWFEDTGFITGDGAGEPLGVLNAGALVSITKETGQTADTIVWENLVKMYSRMLPSSLGSAVWVANNDCFPELATMALSVGTGGGAIWLNNGVAGPPATILGRPLILTEKVPTIGGAGSGKDISFIDFGYYLLGDRMQMRAESSPHVKFSNDLTAYRVIERVDGRPWLQSAITPQNSTKTLSPFVTLGERG
ncbi:MAG: phage major capsid protein [Dehalococcoidia bacterium]|nr:MAG: phage major capsid protein [Dehalococcoidia bacterium]